MSGVTSAIGSDTCAHHRPPADTPQMHVQHSQSEVVAVVWRLRGNTPRPVRKAIVAGIDANLDLGQRHSPKVRNKNDISARPDARNRNRSDAFDECAFE